MSIVCISNIVSKTSATIKVVKIINWHITHIACLITFDLPPYQYSDIDCKWLIMSSINNDKNVNIMNDGSK